MDAFTAETLTRVTFVISVYEKFEGPRITEIAELHKKTLISRNNTYLNETNIGSIPHTMNAVSQFYKWPKLSLSLYLKSSKSLTKTSICLKDYMKSQRP